MSKCEDLVIDLVRQRNLNLPESHLKDVIKEFEAAKSDKQVFSKSQNEAVLDVALENVKKKRVLLRQLKLEQMLRMVAKNKLIKKLEGYEGSEIDGLLTFIRGESKMKVGSRDNLAQKQQGTDYLLYSRLNKKLDAGSDGLREVFESGELDAEIYDIAYQLGAGKTMADIDASAQAKELHEIIFELNDSIRERKNRAGGFIGKRDDYIVAQSHDMARIKKAGFENWKNDFLNLIDEEQTFANLTDSKQKDEYLLELYNRFSTGKHYLVDRGDGNVGTKPTSANLAKKISQSRSIHFKDGASAFEYAQKYSEGSIHQKLFVGLKRDSRTITLMEELGPNPKAVIDSVIEALERRALDKGESISRAKIAEVRSNFDYLNGLHDIPDTIRLAEIGFGLRALESMSKLGGSVLAAGPDLVAKAATLNRRTNIGFFGSYVKAFTDFLGAVPKSEREFAAKQAGTYAEVVNGTIFARVGDSDGMPGFMSRMQEQFFKLNFLQQWTLAHKKGVLAAFSMDLGRYSDVDFDVLPDNHRRNLELYNITADEWNILRFGNTENPATGVKHMTVEAVETLPDSVLDPVIQKLTGETAITDADRLRFKDQLSVKMQNMAVDIMDEGVITPGQRERVLLTLGSQKGTVFGEFMRFAGQFKAFPVTVITKQIMPQYHSAGGGLKGAASLVPMITAMTAMGYVSGAAKDVLKGREPRDPRDPATFADAMVRGGGLGIFGDFMFAEYSRYGRSFQETLLGPGIGTVGDFAALAHKTATLNADSGDYFRFMKNITPGQNLFYTESAFNYLFYYNLMEMNDPGYLRRMEKRREKDYNQDYWLSPSQDSVGLFD